MTTLYVTPAHPAGAAHRVDGRAAEIILAILSHAGEINSYLKGSAELHWGPGGVQGRIHPLWDETLDAALLALFATPADLPARPARTPAPYATAPHATAPHVQRQRAVVRSGSRRLHIHGTEQAPWEAPASADAPR